MLILSVLIAIALLVWIGLRFTPSGAVPIDPADPLWTEAIQRARDTLPVMRELHAAGRDVWLKFPLPVGGEVEHVWGTIATLDGDVARCRIETPPVRGRAQAGPVDVNLAEIEDWQIELEDGTIRGGYTTRAQARMAERDGGSVPPHVREMITRMKD